MACRAINKLGPTYHWYISPLKFSTTKTEVKSLFIPNLLVPPSLFSVLAIRIIFCEYIFQTPCSSTKSNIYFLMFLCFCACRPFHLLCSSLMSPLKQPLLWESFLLIWMESYGPTSLGSTWLCIYHNPLRWLLCRNLPFDHQLLENRHSMFISASPVSNS